MAEIHVASSQTGILKPDSTNDNNDMKGYKFCNKRRVEHNYLLQTAEEEYNKNLKKINWHVNSGDVNNLGETKLPELVINYYYEWDNIPTVTNLPYGLINKDKDMMLKRIKSNMKSVDSVENNFYVINKKENTNFMYYEKSTIFYEQQLSQILSNFPSNEKAVSAVASNDRYNETDRNGNNIRSINNDKELGESIQSMVSSIIYEDIMEYFLKIQQKGTKLRNSIMNTEWNVTNDKGVLNKVNLSHSRGTQDMIHLDFEKKIDRVNKEQKEDRDAREEIGEGTIKGKENEENKVKGKENEEDKVKGKDNEEDKVKGKENEENKVKGKENEEDKIEVNTNYCKNEKGKEQSSHLYDVEINWVHDFINLTNIQILAKNSNTFNKWENLESVLPNIINYCCSPRSCICKNSFLTIKHVCISLKEDKIHLCKFFVHIFPYIVKKLDIKNNFLNRCATNAIEEFMLHSSSNNDYEMLRLICSYSNSKNSSISKKLSYFVYLFIKNIPKKDIINFNLSNFAEPFLNFINAKLEETKKFIKKTLILLLEYHGEDQIVLKFLTGIKNKQNLVILEKQIRNILKPPNTSEPLKKKYETFHHFKSTKTMATFNKTSSFIR
ncbi:hypothetical protein MKS88_004996 [Plasmodium brasilianum]|uniref:Uncharacterized protein n=2 Tax=Plasmodium (Plasmodium) TaxID=418103 RepID=A0A1A8XAM7_PLAMA|nr:conserved Plasmodium protein, unknown function [Plasmodium malariae]KAI4835779.1 hypothetical protein MKS88_004996 [Plasmodium brasilianum]SBT00873.1 conserved Plasmodium protein, unknown function [Plasmodium malariae]SCP02717.1 conserved Plasmodium protein, unknown function [Plasmodium malariae]